MTLHMKRIANTGLMLNALLLPLALGRSSSHGATDSGRDGGAVDSGGADGGVMDSGGAIPRWQRCTVASDCVVVSVDCCGSCGQPSPGDMIGVNSGRISDYRGGRCDGVACPACFMEPDPNLIATCDAGQCQAVDVRTDPVSACSTDSDCSLRTNTCCACSSSEPIAVSGDFSALVCDGDEVCPECAPAFPGWEAVCNAGHCVTLMPPTPAPAP